MAIETICNGCAKKLRVGDEHAGKKARCPDCGTIYTVPAATAPSRSTFDDLEAQPAITGSESFQPLPSFANPPAKVLATDRWLMKIDDGREFGPVDRATLDQWYGERRIGPQTQLRRESDSQWQPAHNVYPALATPFVPSPAVAGANPFAEQGSLNPYAAPSGGQARYAEPHRGALILILALAGWFIGCFFLGIAAWIMASSDLTKMRNGQMDPSGEGLTRAGMIIGIIHVVLSVLMLGLFFMLMVIGIAAGN